jgi:phosphopantetheinyl transferase (holo-ACP synthase)
MKVLGTGHRGISWHDVEIRRRPDGAPLVVLHNAAAAKAALHALEIEISLCHEDDFGVALAFGRAVSRGC